MGFAFLPLYDQDLLIKNKKVWNCQIDSLHIFKFKDLKSLCFYYKN